MKKYRIVKYTRADVGAPWYNVEKKGILFWCCLCDGPEQYIIDFKSEQAARDYVMKVETKGTRMEIVDNITI